MKKNNTMTQNIREELITDFLKDCKFLAKLSINDREWLIDFFLSHHNTTLKEIEEFIMTPKKVCAYCLDTHYMQVNGKLKRGCVWCDNGRKKEGLEPDQLTSLYPELDDIKQLIHQKIIK